MAAGVGTQSTNTYARRVRGVWAVLALAMTLFCAICAVAGTGFYGFLNSLTRPEHARVQLVRGTQLSVVRSGQVRPETINREATVTEGDEILTGPDTEANIDLFDGSTVLLSFNTHVLLNNLHTGRFFGGAKEIALFMRSGTALLSTADLNGYSSAGYLVTTDQAEMRAEPNTTVRVHIAESSDKRTTVAAVTIGGATLTSGGKQARLSTGFQATAAADTPPTDPEPEVQELVRNGDFTQPSTSKAEVLGTAAWQPIIERSGDEETGKGTVAIVTENVGDLSVRAARIDRQAGNPGDGKPTSRQDIVYGKVGLRQEINTSVSYFHLIELSATVKVVAQTEPVGGPQEDVYPLTIRVLYTDSNNKAQEWWHSFYYCPGGHGECKHENATDVPLGQYVTPDEPLVVKRIGSAPTGGTPTPTPPPSGGPTPTPLPDVGPGIAVIDAIEVYGIGNQFQSWITHISLMAR